MANMLHGYRPLAKFHTIAIGSALGVFTGWVMWHEARIGYARIRREKIYFKKLEQDYLNNNNS